MKEGEPLKKSTLYVAVAKNRRLAEASSLQALAEELKRLNLDPREVTITSIPPPSTKRKRG